MTMLSAIRLLAVSVAALYTLQIVPWDSIAMFLDRGLGIHVTTAHSWILTAGRVGVCVSAACAVVLVFAAVPRWRHGVPLLAACFLFMWLSLLTKLEWVYIDRYIGWHNLVATAVGALAHSLPPFILFIVLRQRGVVQQLEHT